MLKGAEISAVPQGSVVNDSGGTLRPSGSMCLLALFWDASRCPFALVCRLSSR